MLRGNDGSWDQVGTRVCILTAVMVELVPVHCSDPMAFALIPFFISVHLANTYLDLHLALKAMCPG